MAGGPDASPASPDLGRRRFHCLAFFIHPRLTQRKSERIFCTMFCTKSCRKGRALCEVGRLARTEVTAGSSIGANWTERPAPATIERRATTEDENTRSSTATIPLWHRSGVGRTQKLCRYDEERVWAVERDGRRIFTGMGSVICMLKPRFPLALLEESSQKR
jgi:hypothetical protein